MSSAMAVPFTGLIMHAVASASEEFPRDSIYMQLDGAQAPLDDADDAAPEVRLVPADASAGVCCWPPSLISICLLSARRRAAVVEVWTLLPSCCAGCCQSRPSQV